jgi:hypothetical protein
VVDIRDPRLAIIGTDVTPVALLLLCATTLQNPSFEDEGLAGWAIEVGARNANAGATSTLTVDRDVACEGEASLRLHGDAGTAIWHMAGQTVALRPGDRVLFRVKARCRSVRPEGSQYRSAHALLLFRDARGGRLQIATSPVLFGDRDWVDLHVHALAPAGVAKVFAGVFLSMSGTVWFDDARLLVAPTEPLDRSAREAAFLALRLHLERTYPFFGLPGKPSPDELVGDPAQEDFHAELRTVLARLKDVHVWIDGPSGRVHTAPPNPAPRNFNIAAVRRRLTETILVKRNVIAGRIGDVGYLLLGSFLQQDFAGVEQALDALADARALLIDVRTNVGGDERLAWRIAGRFAGREWVYARNRVRDATLPGLDGFQRAQPRRCPVTPGGERDARPVVVLQGPYAVSSAEGFLLMMRTLERVRTLGLPSRGASGNPRPFPLLPDTKVWIPTWRSETTEGEPIEGVGVAPEVRFEAEDHRTGDPTLEKALELLE